LNWTKDLFTEKDDNDWPSREDSVFITKTSSKRKIVKQGLDVVHSGLVVKMVERQEEWGLIPWDIRRHNQDTGYD
jgi:hypothetical protein